MSNQTNTDMVKNFLTLLSSVIKEKKLDTDQIVKLLDAGIEKLSNGGLEDCMNLLNTFSKGGKLENLLKGDKGEGIDGEKLAGALFSALKK